MILKVGKGGCKDSYFLRDICIFALLKEMILYGEEKGVSRNERRDRQFRYLPDVAGTGL